MQDLGRCYNANAGPKLKSRLPHPRTIPGNYSQKYGVDLGMTELGLQGVLTKSMLPTPS